MSDKILLALMQLFSLVVERFNENDSRVEEHVENFLSKQLSNALVSKYLGIYKNFIAQKKLKAQKGNRSKRTSVSSVKILLICSQINKELTQKQKIVVLINLLEFVNANESPLDLELDFIKTVSESFNVSKEEYLLCKDFVLESDSLDDNADNVLVISSSRQNIACKQIVRENMSISSSIRIIWVKSVNLFFVNVQGLGEFFISSIFLEKKRSIVLSVGSSIRNQKIKPIYYSDIESEFVKDKNFLSLAFRVVNLSYVFPTGNKGFHTASFNADSGDLIGIMGSSGSGKSTLLNLLNGSYLPMTGKVTINGIDVHKETEKIEGVIGYVSQDDLLIEELTVFQNLFFSAKLSFDKFSDFQITRKVIKVLSDVGLYEARNLKVGNPIQKIISGGQRKRLNIALELIREPSVLFVDEPTSGLSSRDSEIIMDLLRHLTLKGKLIFVVIHQPASEIFKMFDKLFILDKGGYIIYNGNPVDSISYFKKKINDANSSESSCPECGNVSSEEIFDIIESKVVDEYGHSTINRKLLPEEWYKFYKKEMEVEVDEKISLKKEKEVRKVIKASKPKRWDQFKVFINRDVLSKLSNTQYMVINLLESPVLAFILSFFLRFKSKGEYVFKENDNIPAFIFISVIVALFIGLTVSAEEIIKDVKIRKREKFLNLSDFSYLGSKIVIMFFISAVQTLLFVFIGNSILGLHNNFSYWLIIYSVSCLANVIGLNISASFSSAVTIYILIPFLVIPQLLLSGVLVDFDKLNPHITRRDRVPLVGDIMAARWAYEAIAVNQFKDNDFEKHFFESDRYLLEAQYHRVFLLPKIKDYLYWVENNYQNINRDIQKELFDKWRLIYNEFEKQINIIDKIDGSFIKSLSPIAVDSLVIGKSKLYLAKLELYYRKVYAHFSDKRDKLVGELNSTPEGKKKYLEDKKKYTNQALIDFMRNTNDFDKIIEKDNHLIRKTDLSYYVSPRFRSHFYAPYKYVFGKYYNTYWVNFFVIWTQILFFMVVLYFNGIEKTINFIKVRLAKIISLKKTKPH